MNVKLATGPDSWGVWFASDERQPTWRRFLDEALEAGYDATELGPWGYLPTELDVLGTELEKRGLRLCGATSMVHLEDAEVWTQLGKEIDEICAVVRELGVEFHILIDAPYDDLFTGELLRGTELDDESWKRLIETTQKAGDAVRDRWGMQLVFHPHADTHVEFEPQIERLLAETDPSLVGLCLDVGHHAYCGGDPIAFLDRHRDRIPYLHFKSVDADLRDRVLRERIPFAKAVAMDVFTDPSRGAVDFVALKRVLDDIEYEGWAVVEHDMYPAPFEKPLPIAMRTRAYLASIGIG
jgi:inosose dehydratase